MGQITAEVGKIVIMMIAHPLSVLAPKVLQHIRPQKMQAALFTSKVVPHIADQHHGKVTRKKDVNVGLPCDKVGCQLEIRMAMNPVAPNREEMCHDSCVRDPGC